jgi:hypothetical protein
MSSIRSVLKKTTSSSNVMVFAFYFASDVTSLNHLKRNATFAKAMIGVGGWGGSFSMVLNQGLCPTRALATRVVNARFMFQGAFPGNHGFTENRRMRTCNIMKNDLYLVANCMRTRAKRQSHRVGSVWFRSYRRAEQRWGGAQKCKTFSATKRKKRSQSQTFFFGLFLWPPLHSLRNGCGKRDENMYTCKSN